MHHDELSLPLRLQVYSWVQSLEEVDLEPDSWQLVSAIPGSKEVISRDDSVLEAARGETSVVLHVERV